MRILGRIWILFALILFLFVFSSGYYWDAKPTGGIAPVGAPDIVMRQAQFVISPGRISAVYELANETDREIITEIVFPVPEYNFNVLVETWDMTDFAVWADGKAIQYETEIHAFVDGKETTDILREYNITIEKFGFFDVYDISIENFYLRQYEINALAQEQKTRLAELGIIDGRDFWPRWSVRKVYHWIQRFPSKRAVRIRHEYAPIYGITQIPVDGLRQELKDARLSNELLLKMKEAESETGGRLWTSYVGSVRYLLTTVNGWKGPIRDLELIIDDSPLPRSWPAVRFLGFNWEGATSTPDKRTYIIRKNDFTPHEDLAIYYFW